MRTAISMLCAALMAALSGIITSPMPANAATECQWHNAGEYNSYKTCTGITHYYIASRVTDGTSFYDPPNGPSTSASVNFKLSDTAADGECTWIRFRRIDTYWDESFQAGTKVCGKGESDIRTVDLQEHQILPGLMQLRHCQPGVCVTFWEQRVK